MPRPLLPPARRAALRRRLLRWWDSGHRDLPWRFPEGAADAYRVWLSEVMLQQTRVETAVPYYRSFVARWPTLEALAAARDEDVFAAWSGLGYYARCRNLLAAARAAAGEGGLPGALTALRALPGFGPYTAGAVASIAFGIPAAAVDGNVSRVLARLFAVRGDPAGVARERIWGIARELAGERPESTPPFAPGVGRGVSAEGRPEGASSGAGSFTGRAGDWTQALIELGATVCGRAPACVSCPVEALCEARRAGLTAEIPPARRRAAPRAMTLACAVIERRGRVLLERRPGAGLFAGLLALPCAEVPPAGAAGAAGAAATALAAGLAAAGIRARVREELGAAERQLTHRTLRLVAYRCELLGRTPAGQGGRLTWVRWAAVDSAGLPTAIRALLGNLPLAFSERLV